MCLTCGCSDAGTARYTTMHFSQPAATEVAHQHVPHHHPHHHHTNDDVPGAQQPTRLEHLEIQVLAKNDGLAQANRRWLQKRGITALNVMSSPGSGKTTLLVRTIGDLVGELAFAVIEGDQETQLDAERIRATGAPVVQINTGSGCHLDADMLSTALGRLRPRAGSMLVIENVGNLVCPALFDLGEAAKVVVISVTEGADKPLKYPQMFAGADLLLINKLDLLPYVDFDVAACVAAARQVNPGLATLALSATTGEGLTPWYEWVRALGDATQPETVRAR
jgi:hydrogenase nickel incorporation protein HypB